MSRPSALRAAAPYLCLAGAMVSLSVGTSFAKALFPLVGAQGTSAYRVGFSALVLCLVWRPWRMAMNRSDLVAVVTYGAVMGAMNLCFYMALRTIPMGVAIAIEFTGPLSLALVHARKPIHFAWIALAAAGLGLLLPLGDASLNLDPVGVAYAATAAVFWALYIVAGQRTGHLHGGRSVALGMATAAAVVGPFGVAAAGAALLNPYALGLGLAVAVVSSAVPYSLEMVAMRAICRRSFGVMLSLEPAVGALAGLVVLGEHLVARQWLAIAFVIAASVGTVATDPSRQSAEAPLHD
jgi:inner membrane transporter RhtA